MSLRKKLLLLLLLCATSFSFRSDLARAEHLEKRAIDCQLDRVLSEIKFDGVAFSDIIDFLRDVSGAGFDLDWKRLEALGITGKTPITLHLKNRKFTDALQDILDAAGGKGNLIWYMGNGKIVITPAPERK